MTSLHDLVAIASFWLPTPKSHLLPNFVLFIFQQIYHRKLLHPITIRITASKSATNIQNNNNTTLVALLIKCKKCFP
jgi:hypothetical protein